MSSPFSFADLGAKLRQYVATSPSSPTPSYAERSSKEEWVRALWAHTQACQKREYAEEARTLIRETMQLPFYHGLMAALVQIKESKDFCEAGGAYQELKEAVSHLEQKLAKKTVAVDADTRTYVTQLNELDKSQVVLDGETHKMIARLREIEEYPPSSEDEALFKAYADLEEGSGGSRSDISQKAQLGDQALTFLWLYYAKDLVSQGDPTKNSLAMDVQFTYALLGIFSHVNAIAVSLEKIARIMQGKYDSRIPIEALKVSQRDLKVVDLSPSPRGSGKGSRPVPLSQLPQSTNIPLLEATAKVIEQESQAVYEMLELLKVCLSHFDYYEFAKKTVELEIIFENMRSKFKDPVGYLRKKRIDVRESG